LPRVDTDRQATDFVDHEQAVVGKETHALAKREQRDEYARQVFGNDN
jgi:hypothetical protein